MKTPIPPGNYACEVCLNEGMWLHKKLSLHKDHRDGNRLNNDPSNLRWLCPNCHSQTDTYCGRNVRYHPKLSEFDETAVVEALKNSTSISDAMHKLGLNRNNNWVRQKVKNLAMINKIIFARTRVTKDFEEERFQALLNSGINFAKHGWVTLAAPIIGVTPQKVSSWLKLRYPEFYEQRCFTRRLL